MYVSMLEPLGDILKDSERRKTQHSKLSKVKISAPVSFRNNLRLDNKQHILKESD